MVCYSSRSWISYPEGARFILWHWSSTLSAIRPERGANRNSKSGVKGVYWSDREGCWIAKITFRRRSITIGRFSDITRAIEARKGAEEALFAPILEQHKGPQV